MGQTAYGNVFMTTKQQRVGIASMTPASTRTAATPAATPWKKNENFI